MDMTEMKEALKTMIAMGREQIERMDRTLQMASQYPDFSTNRVFGILRKSKKALLKSTRDCEKILEEISKGS